MFNYRINENTRLINFGENVFSKSDNANDIANKKIGKSEISNIVNKFLAKEIKDDIYDQIIDLYNIYKGQYLVNTRKELNFLISRLVMSKQRYDVNLNWIDVSEITDFSYMFNNSNFNGDVSKWNVSNGDDFTAMFAHCPFDGDLSYWEIKEDATTTDIFTKCGSCKKPKGF